MNYCSLKNIQNFDKNTYLRAVALNKVDKYLSTFDADAQNSIRQALYNEEDTSGNYRNGWLKIGSMIDEILNSTVNTDSMYVDGENMDNNSPSVNFTNRISIATVSKKINDIFKVDEVRLFNRNFRKEFLKKCIYDIDTRTAVDSTQLNNEIYSWKESLFADIKNALNITSVSWIDNPNSKELTDTINSLIRSIENMLDGTVLTDYVKERIYFLINMDKCLDETGCVNRDPSLKPFEHGLNGYSFSGGKVKMYHNWSTNEHSDITENSSPMLDFLLETIPCVGDNRQNIHGLYIGNGINNFSSLFVQEFLLKHPSYILKQAAINGIYNKDLFNFLEGSQARVLDKKYENRRLLSEEDRILVINHILTSLYDELLKGVYGDTPDGKTDNLYSNSVHGTIADKQHTTFYQTSMKILKGLTTHVFADDGKGIPANFKKLLFNQMYKTVQNEYLSTSLNKDGVPDITLLHDRHIKSQSSELTNSLVGRIKYFRRNPKVYESTLKRAGIVISEHNDHKFVITLDNGIELNVTMSLEPSGAFTFISDKADSKGYMTEGLMNVLKTLMGNYCGLPEIYDYSTGQKVLNRDRLHTIESYSKVSFLKTVLPVIGTILAGSNPKYKMPTNPDDSNTVNLRHQYALNEDFALLQYILNGYENTNVVKSIEGTSLPNYGLRSSIYDYSMMIDQAKLDNAEKHNSVFVRNPLTTLRDPLKVRSITVNNGVKLNGQAKSISQMSAEELSIQSIFINFLKGLTGEDKIVYHYTTVDSDKARQFYVGFDLKSFKINETPFTTLLNDIASNTGNKSNASSKLNSYISEWMFRRSSAVLSDVIESYAQVYSDLILKTDESGVIMVSEENINAINEYLSNKSVKQLREDFRAAGITLWEEYHFTQPKGGPVQLNESYIYEWLTHSSEQGTTSWLDTNKRQLAIDITKNGESIWYTDFNVKVSADWVNDKKQVIFAKIYDTQTDTEVDFGYDAEQYLFNLDGSVNTRYRIELNPVIEAHFYSDNICSNAFNDIYYGFSENQDNKSKGTAAEKLASRISSGYKRTVHAGSTRHHFGRGWGRSCGTHVRAACIEDEKVVHSTNVIGESSDLEPQDGGAQRTMAQYYIEKWSLGDAAIGYGSAKTIWNDNQQGKSILWKFASYDLSNSVRRASGENSTNSAEDLTRKAYEFTDHTDVLKTLDFSKYFGPNGEYSGYLYKYNPFSKTYSCITSVKNKNNGFVDIQISDCDEKGRIILGTNRTIPHNLNSLYDVDQILGGAYTMVKGESGLEYSEIQSEILAKIICDNELQEEFVAYLLPKSAVKSGRSNMNESTAWKSGYKYNSNNRFGDLWTFKMSTEHCGLMMDAEHEVDSSITETSQMISSLTQNGYTKEEANFVYQIIGQIVEVSKKVYYDNMEDSEESRRKKLEKFVIDALESTKGTSTGISDSDALALFCRKNNISLPLSVPAVLSKLTPAINSELTKEFIRRSYPGVAAVNAPSYNMIETYKFDGYVYDYTSMCGMLYQDAKAKYSSDYSGIAETLLNNAKTSLINDKDFVEALVQCSWKYIDVENPQNMTSINNPYIVKISTNTEIDMGATIVYRKKGDLEFKVERLNSYIESDKWRHLIDLSEYEVYKWIIKPRNFAQPHIQLKVNSNYNDLIKLDQLFTEFDLDTTRALLYFREYLVALEKGKVDQINHGNIKFKVINKVWSKIVNDLPNSSPYKTDLFVGGNLVLDPKHVLLKMVNFQQKVLKDLGRACKNNQSLVLGMQEGFKNKILDYTAPVDYFIQTGRNNVIDLESKYNPNLEILVRGALFLNDFDKKALLDGLSVERGLLKIIYGNSSNTALIINEFQDVFKSSVDSARMLKFVRSMQKAYGLDYREFNASEFLKQMLQIKNLINASEFSEGVNYEEWVKQLRWAVDVRNLSNDSDVTISNIVMYAGQAGLPPAHAKEYMISQHDQVADVLRDKEQFFKKKLKGMVSSVNVPKNTYDFIKVDKHGNAILFKIGNKTVLDNELKNSIEEPIDDYVNIVKLKGEVLCRASLINQGRVDVRRLHNDSDSYIVIRCDSVEDALEVGSSEIFSDRIERFNMTGDNIQILFDYMSHEDNQSRIIDSHGNLHFKHRADKNNNIKTKTLSKSEFDIIHQSKEEFTNLIKEHIIASEKDFINIRSKNLYNSFKDTLKYIGVRTPSQAMQSFMPLEIAIFVGNTGNLVYIPAAMTWFQGADYDIDKSFMMQLGLSGDIVDSGSNLSKKYSFSDLAKLPTPNNNVKFTRSEHIYNSGDLVNNIIPVPSETKYFAGFTFVMLSDILHNNVPQYFNALKTVLNIGNTYESKKVGTHLILVNDLGNDVNKSDMEDRIKWFVSDLNLHNRTKLYNYWSKVMKNKVMYNAYDLLLNPVNLILESMPIDFGEIGEFAKETTSGKRETKITGFNFMDKFIICEQAQLGKKEIGIVATGIKSYLVQTNVGNMKMTDTINGLKNARTSFDRANALNILGNMLFIRTGNSFTIGGDVSKSDYWTELRDSLQQKSKTCVGLLANIDLSPLREFIDQYTTNGILQGVYLSDLHKNLSPFITNDAQGIDLEALYKELTLSNANEDTLMALSALLSAATDNMKELILSKIRASESTMGLFCTMLMQGYSMTQILNVFASDAFGLIDKFSKTNIFNGSSLGGKDTRTIINFLLGEGSLLGNKDWTLTSFLQNKEILSQIMVDGEHSLYENSVVKTLLDELEINKGDKNLIKKLREELLFKKENSLIILKWLNNKISQIQKARDQKNDLDYEVETDEYEDDLISDSIWDEDFIDIDLEEYEDSGNRDRELVSQFTLSDYQAFRQFLEACDYRNNFAESISARRTELRLLIDHILPAAEENKWSGKILKINQGLPKTPDELVKFITSLNAYVNKTLKKNDIRMDQSFDLITFLEDTEMQERFIEQFDKIKKQQNILRTVMDSPNFRSMFKVLKDSYDYQRYAYVTRKIDELLHKYAQEYLPEHDYYKTVITTEEYNATRKVVQEAIESNWLSQLNKTFMLYPGDMLYSRGSNGISGNSVHTPKPIGLSNADQFATFKYLMDNKIFPFLAETLMESPKYATNEFLANLKPYSQRLNRRIKATDFYKMDLNMVNIDKSILLRDQYDKILKDFDLIKDIKLDKLLEEFGTIEWRIGDWTIGELIYVYDIIQNKGKVGKNSFSKLFENSQNNSLYTNRIEFFNKLDKRELDLPNISCRDILFNLAWYPDLVSKINGPIYEGDKPRIAVEWTSNHSKIATVKVEGIQCQIKDLPSDYTFFATPFTTQVSNINFNEEIDSKVQRYNMTDQVVLKALYSALEKMVSGKDQFIKIIDNETIAENPDMFTNQVRIPDYELSPAFYDNNILYINRSHMTTKEPLYALAEVFSWAMSNLEPWRKFLTKQMPTWTDYDNYANELKNHDPDHIPHMIFGRFVRKYVYDKLIEKPEFVGKRDTTEKEINQKMSDALQSIFKLSRDFEWDNIAEYNLQDFVGLIGLATTQKEQFKTLKLGAQTAAKLTLLKKQLISDGNLTISGEC